MRDFLDDSFYCPQKKNFFFSDQLREVPSQLAIFLSNKQYLHATQLLMSALSLGNGNLDGVEALREVRTELQTKKQLIYGKLLEVSITV